VYTGLFNTVSAVTLLLAPLIGGTIAGQIGYEAVFAVALVMVLSAFFVVLRYVRPSSPALVPEAEAAPAESAAR
jgi:hypothetical protein